VTTLAASIDAGQRTIHLSGDVSTAAPGRLYSIEDEIVLLESFWDRPDRVGEHQPVGPDHAVWVVQRGIAESIPVAHLADVPVYGARPAWTHSTGIATPSPVTGTSGGTAETIPLGVIVMWGGTVASIPVNWHLCDGASGTPDLRGLFIKGSAAGVNPGVIGGTATHGHTVTQPADHAALTHSGAGVANHIFTQPGAHTDHSLLAHSAHSGAGIGNHSFTQPTPHVFTQPAGHTAHAFTQPAGHSNHIVTQPANHIVTQPAAHSNHVVTQPANHADNIAHTHVLSMQGGTTAATTGTHIMNSTATGGSVRAITAGDVVASQGTGASLTHSATAVDAHSAHASTAVDAHSAGAVDAHSAHSGGSVDAHSAHSGGAVDAHAGGAVDAHVVTQPTAHTDHAAQSHSAHAGAGVDAHGVTQASQHAAQSHSGAAVAVGANEPAFYSLAYIQKIA
jgi:hypothetical protein